MTPVKYHLTPVKYHLTPVKYHLTPVKYHLTVVKYWRIILGSDACAKMAEHDLTPRISPYLDKHLLSPLLEHVQKQQIYAEDEVLSAQLSLLKKTKLVDFAMDKYKLLHKTEDVPDGASLIRLHVKRPE